MERGAVTGSVHVAAGGGERESGAGQGVGQGKAWGLEVAIPEHMQRQQQHLQMVWQ